MKIFLTRRLPFWSFRHLRGDCARLRDRKKSWLVSKRRASVFLSKISRVLILRADGARLKGHRISSKILFKLQLMLLNRRLDILTPFPTLYDHSVSFNPLSKSNLWYSSIWFFYIESTYDLTDVSASSYDRKTAARHFDTNQKVLRFLSLAQPRV